MKALVPVLNRLQDIENLQVQLNKPIPVNLEMFKYVWRKLEGFSKPEGVQVYVKRQANNEKIFIGEAEKKYAAEFVKKKKEEIKDSYVKKVKDLYKGLRKMGKSEESLSTVVSLLDPKNRVTKHAALQNRKQIFSLLEGTLEEKANFQKKN